MGTWNIDCQLLYRGETWAGKKVRLWSQWPGWLSNSLTHFDSFTDDEGHAEFEIDDDDDKLDSDTPICFTVSLNGENYDFGPYELGGGAFTVDIDPDEDPEEVTVEDLTGD